MKKALKALHIEKKKETPGATHSLIFLGVEIPERFRGALMSPDFVITRYPDVAHCLPYEFYDEDITR